MKPIAEIADEYKRNVAVLLARCAELDALAKSEPSAELRIQLRERQSKLDYMIRDGQYAIKQMQR